MSYLFTMRKGMTVGEFKKYADFQFRTMALDNKNPDKILEHVDYCKQVAKDNRGTPLGDMAERDAKGWEEYVDQM